MKRFDAVVAEYAALGYDSWDDLKPENRRRLVRLYFQEYQEWADALYDNAAPLLDAYEHHDHADLGLAMAQRMANYVKPYINKQLAYQAMCRREQQEQTA